jgi:hypothetical protein
MRQYSAAWQYAPVARNLNAAEDSSTGAAVDLSSGSAIPSVSCIGEIGCSSSRIDADFMYMNSRLIKVRPQQPLNIRLVDS